MWGFFYGLQYRRSASRILLDNKAGVDTKTGQVPQDYVSSFVPSYSGNRIGLPSQVGQYRLARSRTNHRTEPGICQAHPG